MRRSIGRIGHLLLLAAALPMALEAQTPRVDDPSPVEPAAANALKEMGAYLRSLKDFQVKSEGTSELVLTDGQKVQLTKTTNLLARLPNRLMADMNGDQGAKTYFYNGTEFTIFSPEERFYATVPAPASLREVVNTLDEKYDIEIPLADLFLWGAESPTPPALKSAIDIGASEVGGITCEHYAFRQDGLDWQVWIQKGDHPLPRKLVLTTTTDEARPQHTSVLTWNLAPSFNEAAFTFVPPSDARKITFASATPNHANK